MIDIIVFIVAAVLALAGFFLGRETTKAKKDSAAAQRELKRTEEVIEAIEEDLKGETPEEDIAGRWSKV